ncbi:MAG: hypothetical protein IPH45_13490 [Bacteroidales bacterium]|nr:hypothetical protein [Bacteroidales bacterium]
MSAIAGNGSAYQNVAKAPLLVNRFTNVQAFNASLNYEKLFVTCIVCIPNPLPQ